MGPGRPRLAHETLGLLRSRPDPVRTGSTAGNRTHCRAPRKGRSALAQKNTDQPPRSTHPVHPARRPATCKPTPHSDECPTPPTSQPRPRSPYNQSPKITPHPPSPPSQTRRSMQPKAGWHASTASAVEPKSTPPSGLWPDGGEGGIRTHGAGNRHTRFPSVLLKPLGHLSARECWRRGRDSNPRYPYGYSGFRNQPVRPLRHLSAELCGAGRVWHHQAGSGF